MARTPRAVAAARLNSDLDMGFRTSYIKGFEKGTDIRPAPGMPDRHAFDPADDTGPVNGSEGLEARLRG